MSIPSPALPSPDGTGSFLAARTRRLEFRIEKAQAGRPWLNRAHLVRAVVVGLIAITAVGSALGSGKPDEGSLSVAWSATVSSYDTETTALAALPETSKPVSRQTKTKAKPNHCAADETTGGPAQRVVTPSAFCRDAEKGGVGCSAKGHRYICSHYPKDDRNRWKRD
jgi:hypothetical protein